MRKNEQNELRSMVRELRRTSLYEKILDISADGFLIVNAKGNIVDISRAYCAFLGREKKDIIGNYVMDVIKNSRLPEIMITDETEVNVLHRLANGQTPGNEKCVVVTRAAVKEGNAVIGAVGQIYFRKEAMGLAEKLKNMDLELNFYKSELQRAAKDRYNIENIIGQDKQFIEIKKMAEKAAKNDFTVLLFGETGTGKEVFANVIHYESSRRHRPLIRVNCGAIPSELLESELFGYEEGSFTGAKKGGKKGKFELAHGGTIFLDEIGEMPPALQGKLLRAIEEKTFRRVGGVTDIRVDVRIIAATNRNLEEAIARNEFRQDLFYRLSTVPITLPPLREREEDIPLLADYFLAMYRTEFRRTVSGFSTTAMNRMKAYHWPGNVRELRNVTERAVLLSNSNALEPEDLLLGRTVFNSGSAVSQVSEFKLPPEGCSLMEVEKALVLQALERTQQNQSRACVLLGLTRDQLRSRMQRFGIQS